MKRNQWNTFRITGYDHQAGTDQRATGGVHLHQVKRGKAGWLQRVVDSNGQFESAGPCVPITEIDGEAAYETAKAA